MPFKKNYKRKPAYKKRVPYKKKTGSKALVQTIQKVLNKNEETKYVTYYAQNNSIIYYSGSTYNVSNFQLVPAIYQGTTSGNRVGNQIQVTSHIVKYRLFVPTGTTATEPVYCRVMVGHIRSKPADSPATYGFSDFFRGGSGGTIAPQATDLDLMLKPNTFNWVIVYDKIHKIGQSGTNVSNPQCANNDFIVSTMGRINLTKHMGKLQYNDTSPNYPTNKNWYMFVLPVRVGGLSGTAGGTAPVNITYNSEVCFKDA